MKIRVIACALGLTWCSSTAALAWGPEGHAIVADIAQTNLSPAAATEVSHLLATEGHTKLDEVSSWPDEYRVTHPETGPWHFVDIPLKASAYKESRDCHYDANEQKVTDLTCIVARLPYFIAILSNKTQSDADRLLALKFVTHFVGDIHQPLHTEDYKHDHGGNKVTLTYEGNSTNLHAIWDGGIIETQYSWTLGPNYSFDHAAVAQAAGQLDGQISAADRSSWAPAGLLNSLDATIVAWANESHALAPAAYAHLPKHRTGSWSGAYQAYAWPVVQRQLARAGVRLHEILNEALK